jgi:hypothetical protein
MFFDRNRLRQTISQYTPSRDLMIRPTSSCVSTTGSLCLRLARTAPCISESGLSSTALYMNTKAFKAWFCVAGTTFR